MRLNPEETEAAICFTVDQPIAVKAALGFVPEGRQDVVAGGALVWSRIVIRVLGKAATRGTAVSTIITSEYDILDDIAMSFA